MWTYLGRETGQANRNPKAQIYLYVLLGKKLKPQKREYEMKHTFTPYSEELAHEFDPLTSLVYGKVWRFAQMDEGVCRASAERIADELGYQRKAVGKKLKLLADNGYLIETTKPGLKNRPHIYKPSGIVDFQWNDKKQNHSSKQPAMSMEVRE